MTSSRTLLPAFVTALAAACGGGNSAPVARASYTLSVVVTGDGAVTGSPASASCSSGSCSRDFPGGTVVTLVPAPSAGSIFAGWSGGCAGGGSCTVDLTSNRAVTATFAPMVAPGPNVLPLTINGTTCRSDSGAYPNKPCVQVTICLPGTTT